jgi:hypothetical protein
VLLFADHHAAEFCRPFCVVILLTVQAASSGGFVSRSFFLSCAMRRHDLTNMRTRSIDAVTAMRIRQYEQLTGEPVRLPVPIEKIVERVLGLDFDWVEIEERPGEQILAGLIPEERRIVLNSTHLNLFQQKPGLERSTIGHEAGHWDIDIDRTSLHHPRLPGFEFQTSVVRRQATDRHVLVEVLNRAAYDDRYFELYRELTAGQDPPEVRSAVDRYQSSMLMPDWLIKAAVRDLDVTNWSCLYELASLAQVTISNLNVRLHRLNMIYIPEGTRDIYPGRDAYIGQKHLF